MMPTCLGADGARRRRPASKTTSEKYSSDAVRARLDQQPQKPEAVDSYSVKAVRERMKPSAAPAAVAAPASDTTGVSCRIIIHSDIFHPEPTARVILAPNSGPQLAAQLSPHFHDAVCSFVQAFPQANTANSAAAWGQFVRWCAEQKNLA